jgi:hypothetical protein
MSFLNQLKEHGNFITVVAKFDNFTTSLGNFTYMVINLAPKEINVATSQLL